MRTNLMLFIALVLLAACAAAERPPANYPPEVAVASAENGFARAFADRDLAAFAAFISEEAVFFDNDGKAVRGRQAVVESWKPQFEGAEAPFSWRPAQVAVLESGTLALSTGPVYNRERKQFGNFNSIWRKEADGKWRVVFDKGSPHCPEAVK